MELNFLERESVLLSRFYFFSLSVFALDSSPRAPRRYNFVTPEQFKAFSGKGSMLEFGERNGVYYGTLKVLW
jgi:hypothetical protein